MEEDNEHIVQLEREKKIIEDRIEKLRQEARVIDNLIYRYKAQRFSARKGEIVNKKNSDRLFFEAIITDELGKSKHGLRTSQIYNRVLDIGYSINYNTLRSYITRMRDQGVIKKRGPRSYHWVIQKTGG